MTVVVVAACFLLISRGDWRDLYGLCGGVAGDESTDVDDDDIDARWR